jgi:membrane-bound lytic murein transglycosylase D
MLKYLPIIFMAMFFAHLSYANVPSVEPSFYKWVASQQSLSVDSLIIKYNFTNFQSEKKLQLLASSTPLVKYYADSLIKEGIPIEFCILPLIESGNNPQAKSKKDALGLWQFIPETASEYNLKKSRLDERTDVEKSTKAAIGLLKNLYAQLNDWNLVLAAYNWGSGSVNNALKKGLKSKNGKINLSLLPNETRNYLISFYSYNYLINSEFDSTALRKFPNQSFLIKINRSDLYNHLNQYPNLAATSSSVLKQINGYDVFKTKKNEILVPTQIFPQFFSISRVTFKNNVSSNPTHTSCNEKTADKYSVSHGDTFESIAIKNNIKTDKLIDLNPAIRFLRPGMQISICYN